MKNRIIALIALVAILLVPVAGAVQAQGGKTIAEIAIENGNFKTLVAAVQAAGLVDALTGAGPLTVFAPTDEAFAKIPGFVLEYLLKPENKGLLASILTYHVVPAKAMAKDVVSAPSHKTLQGEELFVSVFGDTVKINSATVVTADIEASNGVIHVIDRVILPTITLPEVDPATVKGNIIAAGSSTVFPLTRAVGNAFKNEGYTDSLEVASVGTGAGFERFCKSAETDISNASRPIKNSEREDCRAKNREPIEFFVAIDALAVVVGNQTNYVTGLTVEELGKVFSGAVKTWNEVNPAWPADEIKLFSPGTDSGTFDYFVEAVFKNDKEKILKAPGIQLSEDDNVLVQGVEGTKGAIGYFGFAYYLPNRDKLKAVAINGIEANEANAENGTYPLARPLFIYTTAQIMKDKPQVAAFVNYYLTNVNEQLGPDKVAYFPVNRDSLNLDRLEWLAAQ
jgi:phosphate binding protein